jgi:Flp pilus assembly protein TadG
VRRLAIFTSNGRESGQALVLFAGGLAVFLGLVGLSIDMGQVVQARTDLQKIADAGAFAGSQDLPNKANAETVANQFIVANGNSDCSTSCVEVSTTDEQNDTITVTTKRSITFSFLKFIGIDGTTVTARAKITSHYATGYAFDNQDVFPYGVWGGNGNTGGCTYGVCSGTLKVYRDNGYAEENVEPDPDSNPNWDVNSNKFKGYFHHGTEVYQTNPDEWQTFSYGGNATGQEPIAALSYHYEHGIPVILPVIGAAQDCNQCPIPDGSGANAQGVQFKIVGWVALKLTVDPATLAASQPFQGEVVSHYSSPHGVGGGNQTLPPSIAPRVIKLIE